MLAEMRSGLLDPDAFAYNAAISAVSRASRWDRALGLFLEMGAQRAERDVVTYSATISSVGRGRLWRAVLEVLQDAQDRGVEPNAVAHGAALGGLEKGLQWQRALRLLRAGLRASVETGLVACNSVASALEKGGQWDRAVRLLEGMRRRGLLPDAVTYSAAIGAAEKGQHWEHAVHLFREMQEQNIAPDLIAFSAAVSALGEGRRWEEALAVLRELEERSLRPDLILCNALMSAMEKSCQWERALALLRGMPRWSVRADRITYSAAISAVEKEGLWELALAFLEELESQGTPPDLITCNSVLSACEKGGRLEDVLSLLEEMQERRPQPDAISYNVAILACAGCHLWPHALVLLDAATAQRLSLDANSCSALLSLCEQRGLVEREVGLLGSLEGTGGELYGPMLMVPAVASAAALRLSRAGRTVAARELLAAAAERGRRDGPADCLRRAWEGGGLPLPAGAIRLPGAGQVENVAVLAHGTPYAKELGLLQHVLDTAAPGQSASVCAALDSFGDVLGASGQWSKSAGGSKASVLVAAVQGAPVRGHVLEIGTYCGYSSVRMAIALPGVRIETLELNPIFVVIARSIVLLAGLREAVDVWTGHSRAVLPRLAEGARADGRRSGFGAVFMDRWGSQYTGDLDLLEEHDLLEPGAVIVADNVLRTGAPLLLWRAVRGGGFQPQVVSAREHGLALEDWLLVAVRQQGQCRPLEPPQELLDLHTASERRREWAVGAGRGATLAERAVFADEVRTSLARAGISSTADSLGS